MLYLSKQLGALINRTSGAKSARQAMPAALRLGFVVDPANNGEPLEQVGGLVPKAISKFGNEYTYTVAHGLGEVKGLEERYAEETKAEIVETLSREGGEANLTMFGRARTLATDILMKRMGRERADYLSYLIAHDTVGYGPISILLEDKQSLEEIEINAPCTPINIYHVAYGRCKTNLRFRNEEEFRYSINKFIYSSDKELDEGSPIIDAQVEDARIHAQIKPYALSGAVASIRITDNKVVGPQYLIKKETAGFEVLAYLWLAMDACENMIIAGSPASGKTTLLSALFAFVPRAEKIATIEEDVNELKVKIDINNTVSLYGSRYKHAGNTREQVINALRMRPDRLVVGEIRGDEARELFSGANLGMPFITTMHSNQGGVDIIKKLMAKPMSVEARSLSMLDLAVYMRHIELSKRVLSDVYEYRWLSRAETEKVGIEVEGGDSVDIVSMVSNGRLASELLMGSKVVDAFSKKRDMPKKAVIKEHLRRAEFLKVVSQGCKNADEMLAKIQGYGW